MSDTFLREEDLIKKPDILYPSVSKTKYVPDYGLESEGRVKYVEIERITLKTGLIGVKSYNKNDLKNIMSEVFGIEKTVMVKSEMVKYLTSSKSLVVIERYNHLKGLNRKK